MVCTLTGLDTSSKSQLSILRRGYGSWKDYASRLPGDGVGVGIGQVNGYEHLVSSFPA